SAFATGRPVLVSTSERCGERATLHYLFCPEGYPTPIENVRLPIFNDPDDRYTPLIGLSSHCLDPMLPVAAVARGCKLIEMHFMLADEPSELEANVSLNQYQANQ